MASASRPSFGYDDPPSHREPTPSHATLRTEQQNKDRVLFFTTHLGGGGAEAHLLRVANHIATDQFEPVIATLRSGGAYEEWRAPQVEYVPLANGSRHVGLQHHLRVPRTLLRLRSLLREKRPRVVYSALNAADIHVALARRGLEPRPLHVVCVQAPPSVVHGSSELARTLCRWALKQADAIVPISHGVARDVEEFCPGSAHKSHVIYNACVDDRLERLTQAESIARPQTGRLLLACGRLTEQKGFEYLIEAMALVRRSCPDVQLWIVGQGPLKGALEQKVRALELRESVRFVGFQSNPFAYMKVADLFVLSSVFEGLGMVIVEAMACGTPVVSTDCPHGPAEILRDEAGGLLVPPRDPQALAQAITSLLQAPERLASLAARARRRAMDFHSTEIARQYASLAARLQSASSSAAQEPRSLG